MFIHSQHSAPCSHLAVSLLLAAQLFQIPFALRRIQFDSLGVITKLLHGNRMQWKGRSMSNDIGMRRRALKLALANWVNISSAR